ncbi:conserved hypothetical protein [Xenorhabdus bovienii str. kraussei Becker Underwood]|uniref:Uncharacterized protein n=1 Tax=Xenorhabdus bovienii str. kraussei Becker Underwood TaxID=1398204 RepID=A0A077PPW7_XENBV|nr:conserved hypothetical protein [Xenorhabdus bovienii str. kraussei Becker Underwood]
MKQIGSIRIALNPYSGKVGEWGLLSMLETAIKSVWLPQSKWADNNTRPMILILID